MKWNSSQSSSRPCSSHRVSPPACRQVADERNCRTDRGDSLRDNRPVTNRGGHEVTAAVADFAATLIVSGGIAFLLGWVVGYISRNGRG